MSGDIKRLTCGLTVEQVRALMGTPEPEPREPDDFEPYVALFGDQKSRNEQIQHDTPLIMFLGMMDLPHERIGKLFQVSRTCVRNQLSEVGVTAKKRIKFQEYRKYKTETYYRD